jgi:hypothetical protein
MGKYLTIVILLGLILCSCTASTVNTLNRIKLQKANIGVIYTDALKEDSELVLFNNEGQIIDQEHIRETGIFQIVEGAKGNLVLPVQFGKRLVHISRSGEVAAEDTLAFPLYTREGNNIRVTTYNTDLNYGTLEIRQGTQQRLVKLDGFLRVANFDEQFVYIFATVIQEKKPVLYVVDRATGKLVTTLALQIDLADDLIIIDHKIMVSSIDQQHKIAIIDKRDWQQHYLSLPYAQPEFFYQNREKIYITHPDQGGITVLDRHTLQILQTAQLPQVIYKARLFHNKLYVLSQLDETHHAGLVRVYNIHTWKQEREFLLPKIRGTLVQDLTILK